MRAEPVILPDHGGVADQVDQADETGLDANRQLNHQRARAQAVGDHFDRTIEIRADAVHFVHETDARHAVFIGLAPHRLGLRLDTGNAIEKRHRPVQHAQAALDFDGEVDMAGGCR